MSSRFTPWGDRAAAEVQKPVPKKAYGVDWMEMQRLRAIAQHEHDTRDPAAVMIAKVEKHFHGVKRTTVRKCARSLSMKMADVRQMIARLIDLDVLERDGVMWEDSVQSGQRDAAAYRWREDGPRDPSPG